MQNNDTALIRDFQHRYKQISATSGYALVYDTLALIREFIPCREIGVVIVKPNSEDPRRRATWKHAIVGCHADNGWVSAGHRGLKSTHSVSRAVELFF